MKNRRLKGVIRFSTGLAIAVLGGTSAVHAQIGAFCVNYAPGGVNFGALAASGAFNCADASVGGDAGPGTSTDPSSAGTFGQTANASGTSAGSLALATSQARADANAGVLRVFASSTVDARPVTEPVRSASGRASAFFFDSGFITSPTLAAGTPVTLSGVASVEGSFQGPNAIGVGLFRVYKNGFSPREISFGLGAPPAQSAAAQNFSFNDFVVGDRVDVFMSIIARGDASNVNGASRIGVADMENTGRLFFSVDTPGAQFIAASGHNYAIPEPSTVILCALGLGALAFRVGSRRRR